MDIHDRSDPSHRADEVMDPEPWGTEPVGLDVNDSEFPSVGVAQLATLSPRVVPLVDGPCNSN